jgi:molecular chaperone DnaK (HSP70)
MAAARRLEDHLPLLKRSVCFCTLDISSFPESIENTQNKMKTLAAILIVFSILFPASPHDNNQDALLGIDFGSEWIKLAVISQGSRADTVLNENSKRKTLSAILFPEPASNAPRQFGEAAMVRPHKVFVYLRELLGVEHNRKGKYGPHQYYHKMITDDRRAKLMIMKDKDSYSPEFLNAMLLLYSKARAETHSGKNISKCVITVPPYYTSSQRLALLSAARIAGKSPVGCSSRSLHNR